MKLRVAARQIFGGIRICAAYVFGTAVTADRQWPHRYGVIGDYVPEGFVRQFLFPFVGSTESREERETTKLPVPPPTDGAPIVTNEPPPAL